MKIHPVGDELYHASGQTHVKKLIVVFAILLRRKKKKTISTVSMFTVTLYSVTVRVHFCLAFYVHLVKRG